MIGIENVKPSQGNRVDKDEQTLSSFVTVEMEREEEEEEASISLRNRFAYEISAPFFHAKEPNGLHLDLRRTFAPDPFLSTLFFKSSFFALSLSSLASEITGSFLLLHWALLAAVLYQFAALLVLLRRDSAIEGGEPRLLVCVTWGLYGLAAPLELLATLLYWTLEHEGGSVSYSLLMPRGGVCVLVLLDGWVLGFVPPRVKQVLLVQIVCAAYALWTLASAFVLDNPEDILGGALRWRSHPWVSAGVALGALVVLPSLLFFLCWGASLWSGWLVFDGSRRRCQGLVQSSKTEMLQLTHHREDWILGCLGDNQLF